MKAKLTDLMTMQWHIRSDVSNQLRIIEAVSTNPNHLHMHIYMLFWTSIIFKNLKSYIINLFYYYYLILVTVFGVVFSPLHVKHEFTSYTNFIHFSFSESFYFFSSLKIEIFLMSSMGLFSLFLLFDSNFDVSQRWKFHRECNYVFYL